MSEMHKQSFTPEAFFSFTQNADTLAQCTVRALHEGRIRDAVGLALFFASRYPHMAESHALCALTLARLKNNEASRKALDMWDTALRMKPHHMSWLASALRLGWNLEDDTHIQNWILLLEHVFITHPPPDLLADLEAHGWKGHGSAGIHQGQLMGWTWLPEDERPQFSVLSGGPALEVGSIRRLVLGNRAVSSFSIPLPKADKLFFVRITDSTGRDVQGSPVVCDPVCTAARPIRSLRQIKNSRPVAVIMPVYGDTQVTLSCLGTLFASRKRCKTSFEIVVVWDHGPDATLLERLQRLALQKKITLHVTPRNLGFLATINVALTLHPQQDVILLNADTLVHGDWVDRLKQTASRSRVATVTPFGSFAELLSFPSPQQPGDITRLADVRSIDTACKRVAPQDSACEIPVGVGFCMYITRKALDVLKGFDGYQLHRGYGEEVDFCLRAREKGFRNLVACNVFVAHLGNRSFGFGKKAFVAQNNLALFECYPEYDREYREFLRVDPLQRQRARISQALLRSLNRQEPIHVCSTRDMLAPSFQFLRDTCRAEGRPWAVLLLQSSGNTNRVVLQVEQRIPLADMHFQLPADFKQLCDLLSLLQPSCLLLHSTNPAIKTLVDTFQQPCRQADSLPATALDPLSLHERSNTSWLVVPPRTVAGWKKLCRIARQGMAKGHVFWVMHLETLWQDAPRPLNMLPARDEENIRFCVDGLLTSELETALGQGWERWATEHDLSFWQLHEPTSVVEAVCA